MRSQLVPRRRGFRYRLRATPAQERALERAAHARRFVYNWGLERSRRSFEATGHGISLEQQCADLTALKREPTTSHY